MRILYFASLRETLDCASEEWPDSTDQITVKEVIDTLKARGEPWHSGLNDAILVAVDQDMATVDTDLSNAKELAFFPPVTGG